MSSQRHQRVDSLSNSRFCAYLILGTPKHPLSAYVSRPPFSTPIICGKRTKHICLPYSTVWTSRSFVSTLPENIHCYQNYKEHKALSNDHNTPSLFLERFTPIIFHFSPDDYYGSFQSALLRCNLTDREKTILL